MKRLSLLLFASIIILFSLVACGGNETPKATVEPETSYVMSTDEEIAVIEQCSDYIHGFLDFSNAILNILLTEPDLLNNEKIRLSDYPDFNAAKTELFSLCDEVENYNTENLTPKLKSIFPKLIELSKCTKTCAVDVSKEMTVVSLSDYMVTFSTEQASIVEEIGELATVGIENNKHTQDTASENTKTQSSYNYKSFTNKYGTATTRCIHAGCNDYISSSGDTNCCTKHSARCLNCNCYIDEDAMYCMSCLSSNSKSSSSYSSNTCKYTYSSGSICGTKTNKYKDLCDKHFSELNSIYQSFTN